MSWEGGRLMIYSIRHPEYFEVHSGQDEASCYGCDQEWYNSEWQRLSGCGPTAASNIIYYLSRTKPRACKLDVQNDRGGCLALMEEVWTYVTPTEEGVDTTKKFYDALRAYFDAVGTRTAAEICDIPENKDERPALKEVLDFLITAMENDAPVAFLNLCNGDETNLEEWHWVTVISLRCDEGKAQSHLIILDEGQFKKIDLGLWHNTTELGGGFVYFAIPDE